MSHSFYVGGCESLAYEDVLGAVDRTDLRCVEGALDAFTGPWPDKGYLHFFRWGLSTRTVEVSNDDGVFNARIMVASCPDDYRLALDLVEAAARAAGTTIRAEDGHEDVAPDAIGAHWDDAWIEHHSHSMARTVISMAESSETGETMTMGGPARSFSLGPRIVARLRAGPDEGIEERLFTEMRRLQYIADEDDDGDGIYCAKTMAMRRDDTEVRFAVWGPGVAYLMPPVDYLALIADEQIMIPVTAASKLAPGRVEYLDDVHLHIGEVPEGDWHELVAAARAHAIDPFAG